MELPPSSKCARKVRGTISGICMNESCPCVIDNPTPCRTTLHEPTLRSIYFTLTVIVYMLNYTLASGARFTFFLMKTLLLICPIIIMLSPHATVAMRQTAKGNGAKVQQQLHLMLYNTTISREPLESPVQVVPPTMATLSPKCWAPWYNLGSGK